MTGERWEPSPTVRAYQGVTMIVPALIAGASALSKEIHIGSRYTPASGVSRFQAAQNQGDTATARLLIDQTFHHAFLENIPDAAVHQANWRSIQGVANPENRAYMDSLALTAGGAVPSQKGPNANTNGGVLDSLAGLFQQITGPTADAAAVKAGQATATSLRGTVILVGVGVVGLVVLFVLLRRRA